MPLNPGTRLGPYEILAPLGAGGMGEVYRARDTRLGRNAALKVLPEHLAFDPERMARFEREAKLLASLNHPNIAAIYGLETADRVRFLAMELVEGEDLARRLERGAIGFADAAVIALKIAEALEDAHEKGIVHRDLKPANVMLGADERVKVLDFGLAKALEGDLGESGVSDISRSPTVTNAMTGANVILGTAAYMSPEQARGRRVDKRADIWAFGCVLFEMLTGRRAFEGETVSDTLASVLKLEPEWAALPRDVPASMIALVRRCLDKDPKRRLRDIGEARLALEKIRAGDVEATPGATAASTPATKGLRLAFAIALALVAAISAGALAWLLKPTPVLETSWTDLLPPPGNTFALDRGGHFALSPEGDRLVFVAQDSTGTSRLWMRNFGAASSHVVSGTEGATYPFWSPDGRAIGFFADRKVKRIDVDGGAPLTLGDAPDGRGGSWSPSGEILFAPGRATGLFAVSASGGDVRSILEPDKTSVFRWPHFLSDGKKFLCCAMGESISIWASSLDGDPPQRILMGPELAGNVTFADGRLYYVQEGALRARSFDPRRLALGGEAVTIASSVSAFYGYAKACVTVAPGGALAFFPGVSVSGASLIIYDRTGRRLASAHTPYLVEDLSISPDGRRVAMARHDGQDAIDIWVYDLEREMFTRLTFSGTDDDPAWSPDGDRIAWAHGGDIYVKSSSGAGTETALFESDEDKIVNQWSPDGRFILYTRASSDPDQIWALDVDAREPRPLRASKDAWQTQPRLSSDGRWLAYASNESGEFQVYVQDFPEMRGRWQISTDSGRAPLWKLDGTELYYVGAGGRAMAVQVDGRGSSFVVGAEEVLYDAGPEPAQAPRTHSWAVVLDGERFIVIEPENVGGERAALTIVSNWRPNDAASGARR